MEKVMVTGASGFIGQHLVRELTRRGFMLTNADPDRVYHLACPSSTEQITNNTLEVMDAILDGTREVIRKWPNALIINASSMGAAHVDDTRQGAYNTSKRCMEIYLAYSDVEHINYRIPATYGFGMNDDAYIKRCIDGRATKPTHPDTIYYIAHVSEVVDALVELRPVVHEQITLGEIYEQFNSGRRGLHRPTFNARAAENETGSSDDR